MGACVRVRYEDSCAICKYIFVLVYAQTHGVMAGFMSTWLVYSTQLFSLALILVFLWSYFITVILIYNQLTLNKGNHS